MKILMGLFILSSVFYSGTASAQKKMDLDDLVIKGEVHNSGGMRLLSREKYKLKNFIQLRQNYRDEIAENIPASKKSLNK